MPSADADVIVVGAGPAGAVTALLLARAGHEVLILDRYAFPRPKPCGDCLSAATGSLLDRLGLLPSIERERPARLRGWRIFDPDGVHFEAAFPVGAPQATALALPRERLDLLLLEAAIGAGARVRTGVRVYDLLRDHDGTVTGVLAGTSADRNPVPLAARLVVGADGLRSVVARRLGLIRRPPRLRKLSLTAHIAFPDLDDWGEMHLADGACAGLAPVRSGHDPFAASLANLTLVADARRFGSLIGHDAIAFFEAQLRRFPALAIRLPQGGVLPAGTGKLLASGPFDWQTRDVVAPGAALVGDAAGYYDPFTGQGVHQAIAGACILAEEADAALSRASVGAIRTLRGYARRRARLVRPARRLQQLIELVTARPALSRAAIRRIRSAPAIGEALVAVTGDLRSPSSLLAPRLLREALLPARPPETVSWIP